MRGVNKLFWVAAFAAVLGLASCAQETGKSTGGASSTKYTANSGVIVLEFFADDTVKLSASNGSEMASGTYSGNPDKSGDVRISWTYPASMSETFSIDGSSGKKQNLQNPGYLSNFTYTRQ